jgi:lipid-A-disaccharide synthase
MKIYIIAGEASGDIYGAKLMDALRTHDPKIEFNGIGGDKMIAAGLSSLFPMQEISIMGFLEVLPHAVNLLNRIDETVTEIEKLQPDIVITIDSPGFCCRVAKQLRKSGTNAKLVHYVAPTVWAYKPGRAQKFANLFDHLLVILPFEPPYFEAVNLPCTYIGHPITETKIPSGTSESFRKKHKIDDDEKIVCIMPGSRNTELKKLLPEFLNAAKLLSENHKLRIIIPTIPHLADKVRQVVGKQNINAIILDNDQNKLTAFKAADIALVKSGTGTFEVALAGCPMVVAYKTSWLSYRIIKSLVKIRFANLINLILDKEVIPELLQYDCNAANIAKHLEELLSSKKKRDQQVTSCKSVLKTLGLGQKQTPSEKAAKAILGVVKKTS